MPERIEKGADHRIGALLFRRARGFWCIDEFDHEGRYVGSHSGNHSFPRIEGWRHDLEWPNDPVPIAKLALPAAYWKEQRHLREPRKGLVRCVG